MTLTRLVVWMLVWGTGWALFFVHPQAHSSGALVAGFGIAANWRRFVRNPAEAS
jgi:hypothetical protein